MRSFRFGASVWAAGSAAEWRAKAQRVEALGFDVLLTADHLAPGMFPPVTALVAAAEATDRLRVGTLVVNNDFRHPVVLAREAAAVDLLTDGRLELGIGAGHMKHEYDEAGIVFDRAGTRVARLGEAVAILGQLFSGEEVTFDGTYYQVHGHRLFPATVQRPLPLLVGGNGRKVLTIAAERASIVGFTGFSQVEGERSVNATHFTSAGLAEQLGWVRAAAGDRFDDLELSTLVQGVVITDRRRATAEALLGLLPSLSADDVLSSPYSLIGTAAQIADQLRQRREELGLSYVTVFEKDMDAFAEVIELLRE